MTKITIQAIKNEEKTSAKGKNYLSCSIKTIGKDGQEIWLSGFGNETTKSWKKGQTVELDIVKKESNGKTYWNFNEVAERSIFEDLDKINDKLDLILFNGKKVDPTVPPQILEEKQTTEQILDSIPF